ncbi:hypothetical protein [Aeromonas salmonicida]|uniref:hypothetical protein n=1 Tax=Aeromonas salmonicida TaxID=645 RepID=UPI001EDFA087|nr:hypothetical protein [Aeromonas salmonicida]
MLIVSDTSAVELKIDPSVVLATRKYVDDVMAAHKLSRDHPDASETAKGFTRLATQEQVDAVTADDVVVTPKKLTQHYKRKNILGVVSQTAGIPTGAIIERGSNANGEYIKFADGTLVCIASVSTVNHAAKELGAPTSACHWPHRHFHRAPTHGCFFTSEPSRGTIRRIQWANIHHPTEAVRHWLGCVSARGLCQCMRRSGHWPLVLRKHHENHPLTRSP